MNPYEILGVNKNSSQEEIKQKYKSLAQIHHPDKGGDEEKFKQINQAYDILSDPEKKQYYDDTGRSNFFKTIEEEAVDELANIFYNVVDQFNPITDDVLAIINNAVFDTKNHLLIQNEHLQVKIEKYSSIFEKIKKKTESNDNLFHQFSEYELENLKQFHEKNLRKIQVYDQIKQLLDQYYYNVAMLIKNES